MLKNCLNEHLLEAGCDEAGRGCLAGPVFAAAVILPKNYENEKLNDSKQLNENQRYYLRESIIKDALCYGVAKVSNHEIDNINILNASFLAMHRALDKLIQRPEFILVDGNRFKTYQSIPHACIVKGDGKYMNIAAASILAKTFRDDWMKEASIKYPHYQWDKNMGYPTRAHRKAIEEFGPCEWHRMSFQLLPSQLRFNF